MRLKENKYETAEVSPILPVITFNLNEIKL